MKGKKHKPESIEKMRLAKLGKKMSPAHRKKISEALSGSNHPNWGGGQRISATGYVLLHKPNHPNARKDGYIEEHSYVMSGLERRPLRHDEIDHHIDGDIQNNQPENLLLTTQQNHAKDHGSCRLRDELGRYI